MVLEALCVGVGYYLDLLSCVVHCMCMRALLRVRSSI